MVNVMMVDRKLNTRTSVSVDESESYQPTCYEIMRIIAAGLVGGTVGSFLSLLIHYWIATSGIIPGF